MLGLGAWQLASFRTSMRGHCPRHSALGSGCDVCTPLTQSLYLASLSFAVKLDQEAHFAGAGTTLGNIPVSSGRAGLMPLEWDAAAASRRCSQLFGTGAPIRSAFFVCMVLSLHPHSLPSHFSYKPNRSACTLSGAGWPPNTTRFNEKFGWVRFDNATRILFLAGASDPWQWAGISQVSGSSLLPLLYPYKLGQPSLSWHTGAQRQPAAARPWQ